MQKSGRLVLTVVALIATVLALYVQIFELRSRQAEDRLEAARLDNALAASRARLKSEILAELRAELAEKGSKAPHGTQPLPNTILRRLESGGLRQSADPLHPEESLTLPQLNASLSSLAQQVEESERSVRRDLEELRAATLRQAEVSFRVTGLILVALIPLLVQLLLSGLPPRRD